MVTKVPYRPDGRKIPPEISDEYLLGLAEAELTLRQIADKYGVSRECIRQRLARARRRRADKILT